MQSVRRMRHALAKAVIGRPLTACDQSRASPGGLSGGESGTGTVFSSSAFVLPWHAPVLHTHIFIYHRRYIISATDSFVK